MNSNTLIMNKTDKVGETILSIAVGAQQLLLSVQILLGNWMFSPERMANFRVIVSALVVIASMVWILRRSLRSLLWLYLVAGVLFLSAVALSPQLSRFVLDEGIKFTSLTCIPITLAVLSIRDLRIFHKTFLVTCIITAVVGILYSLLLVEGLISVEDTYNMAFGYSLMLPVLYFFYTKKPFFVFLGVLTTISIILNGSRGPAIVIFIYVFYLFYRDLNFKRALILILGIVLVYLFFTNIGAIVSFLSNHGIYSRTLLKLLDNELLESTSREDISRLGIEGILRSPYVGYGVFGDRLIHEPYIHNFILEVFLDFGIPIGLFLLVLIVIRIMERYQKHKGQERDFFILIVFGSFLPLLASGSYLVDFRFFFVLGVLLSPLNRKFVV